ncbi:inositol monophosphatase family protein [Fibrella arboris]|uniref:inositol monophosphatase family protein n=1 Tax=Fibrella arboris TaxID=3242486 RepID=UPI00352109E8
MTFSPNFRARLNAIAREAGTFLLVERHKFSLDAIEYKGLNDLVSYVDKECEKMLVPKLHALLPEAGFITEEGTTDQADKTGLNWIIDPLDGTTNFIHGLPIFAVSIGLAQGNRPIAGVVYDPNRDECFSAVEGLGAWLSVGGGDEQPMRVSGAQKLADGLIATGFPYYRFEQMQPYLQILEQLMQRTHGLRRMGSAAIDLAYVAAGRFEAFFEYNLKSWDMAAGMCLVREAGGIVTDFEGGDTTLFGGDVVAGCAVQPELLGIIGEYWGKSE